jgi:hypothetical protein
MTFVTIAMSERAGDIYGQLIQGWLVALARMVTGQGGGAFRGLCNSIIKNVRCTSYRYIIDTLSSEKYQKV